MNSLLWKFIRTGLCAGFALLLLADSAWSGGFSIYEQGANATALGSAMVARPWDVTAAFFNPAGLAMYGTPGQWRFYGGIVPVQSMGRFTGMNPSPGAAARDKAVDKFFFPFHLHAAYQINENMAAGLAVTTPFGLGTEWDNKNNQYSGRFRSIQADIQSVFISPSFSYKFNDNFSFGAGIDYVYCTVYLERNNPQTFFDGTNTNVYDVAKVKMDGTDKGSFGFNFGAFYKFDEKLSFGVNYKHKIKNDIKGTAKFSQINTGNAVIDNTVYASLHNAAFGGLSQDGNTTIEFPNMAVIGVAYKPIDKLVLDLDYCWVGWKVFKEVVLKFPENQLTPSSTLDESYKNTYQIRFSAEYQAMDKLALRCGYIYDHTPAPTKTVNPLLPCADRHDIGLGIGYKFTDAFYVDASYMAVNFMERSTKGKNVDGYDGIYNTHVNLFSMSLGYSFGGK